MNSVVATGWGAHVRGSSVFVACFLKPCLSLPAPAMAMAWVEVLSSVPPPLRNTAVSLRTLCDSIQSLATTESVLHPSKCRCLAHSYSKLTLHVLSLFPSLSTSPSSSSSSKVCKLFTLLLCTLERGERFIQDCSYQVKDKLWSLPGKVRKQTNKWLANNALAITLSTGIFDVYLHDFLWCICMLIWVLSDHGDGGLCGWIQAKRVEVLLKHIWASADEEGDVKSMRELFSRIRAKGHEQICNLLCARLSDYERASKGKSSLKDVDVDVPTYLWMDPQIVEIESENFTHGSSSGVVRKGNMLGRTFACKQFNRQDEDDPQDLQFKFEAVVQAQLWHANVIDLVCCTRQEDRTPCLVMGLMDQDLESLIEDRGEQFSLLQGLDLMLQVAKGMEYLHGLGLMHRDLKSPNILVSLPEATTRSDEIACLTAKIADFGVSKVKHHTSLFTSKRVGTGAWRAPEVLDDDDPAKYTKKADVYSFAIVWAEILTGLSPGELFGPRVSTKMFCKLLKEGKRPGLPASCPLAISSYIKQCWHGDASKRPGFTEICRALRFFKACVFLEETEMLASSLQEDMLDVGMVAMQRTRGQGQLEGVFYHPVLDIPFEARIFQSVKEQKPPRRREGDMLKTLQSKILASSTADLLGEGSLGSAFKCDPGDGFIIAVRWLENVIADREHVERQVAAMLELKHKNLVPLLAHYSNTENVHVLVLEHITNGISLSNLLQDGNKTLSGETILMVAEDAASGIQHLHDHGFTHGHIKSSNILLINNYTRCVLSDYGIATLVRDTAGNVGYGAPELSMSKEADVYSYGMLLLELLTGLNPAIDKETLLWVNSQSQEEKMSILEQRSGIGRLKSSLLMDMLRIASDCLNRNASQRPFMKQVGAMVRDSRRRLFGHCIE